jgi:hypothetical protein
MMNDEEIAKCLKDLVFNTGFQGSDHKRVACMVQWLEDIESGRKTVTPKEGEPNG